MQRVIRIAGSLAIVVVAYWLYALFVVRWIEPSVDPNHCAEHHGAATCHRREVGGEATRELRGLFLPAVGS